MMCLIVASSKDRCGNRALFRLLEYKSSISKIISDLVLECC